MLASVDGASSESVSVFKEAPGVAAVATGEAARAAILTGTSLGRLWKRLLGKVFMCIDMCIGSSNQATKSFTSIFVAL